MKTYKSLLHEIADPENLKYDWRKFHSDTPPRRRDTAGIDGVSINLFHKNQDRLISAISKELLSGRASGCSSDYKLFPLAVFPLEKPEAGKYRIICIPTVKDRLIQKTLLRTLAVKNISVDSAISYGCNQNKSVNKAIKKALHLRGSRPWVYKTDITQFFDRVESETLKCLVKKRIRHRSIHGLIFQSIDAEISDSIPRTSKQIVKNSGIRNGVGLRQGLPLSPLLSNLFLETFDRKVVENGFSAVRYVDDLIFFCESEAHCWEVDKFCRSTLKERGLDLPEISKKNKTCIYGPEQTAEFLGMGVKFFSEDNTYKLIITDTQIKAISDRFQALKDIKSNLNNRIVNAETTTC